MGSAWRGGLGHALKKTVCVMPHQECKKCLLNKSCAYPYVFDTPPQVGQPMQKYNSVPHPYVLQLPFKEKAVSQRDRGESLRQKELSPHSLGLVLIGKGQEYLPYLLHALQQAGVQGIGKGRSVLELKALLQTTEVGDHGWHKIYEVDGELEDRGLFTPSPPTVNDEVVIELLTPFRTKAQGHLVTPQSFSFAHFFSPLMRRISMLHQFHGKGPLDVDYRALSEQAREVELKSAELHWKDWTRYSNRQGKTMKMGGVMGRFTLSGGDYALFREWIWLGQWVGNGKAVTMGLGRYTVMF